MPRRYNLLGFSILFLIQVASARPQTPNPSLVTSPRPLVDASRRLQEVYGKVVTYEEPILTWRAELGARTGGNPEERWQLVPPLQSFSMPAIDAKAALLPCHRKHVDSLPSAELCDPLPGVILTWLSHRACTNA